MEWNNVHIICTATFSLIFFVCPQHPADIFTFLRFPSFFLRCPEKTNEQFFLYLPFKSHRIRLEKFSIFFVTWNVEEQKVLLIFFSRPRRWKISFSAPVAIVKITQNLDDFLHLGRKSLQMFSTVKRFKARSEDEKGWKFPLWSFFPVRENIRATFASVSNEFFRVLW